MPQRADPRHALQREEHVVVRQPGEQVQVAPSVNHLLGQRHDIGCLPPRDPERAKAINSPPRRSAPAPGRQAPTHQGVRTRTSFSLPCTIFVINASGIGAFKGKCTASAPARYGASSALNCSVPVGAGYTPLCRLYAATCTGLPCCTNVGMRYVMASTALGAASRIVARTCARISRTDGGQPAMYASMVSGVSAFGVMGVVPAPERRWHAHCT